MKTKHCSYLTKLNVLLFAVTANSWMCWSLLETFKQLWYQECMEAISDVKENVHISTHTCSELMCCVYFPSNFLKDPWTSIIFLSFFLFMPCTFKMWLIMVLLTYTLTYICACVGTATNKMYISKCMCVNMFIYQYMRVYWKMLLRPRILPRKYSQWVKTITF